VAILDADKEGFLRSGRSLIQTIGRAARNVAGKVLMYAERVTDSMAQAIEETERRRSLQLAYNAQHGITPRTVQRSILDLSSSVLDADYHDLPGTLDALDEEGPQPEAIPELVEQLRQQMFAAAEELDFERAAQLRDRIKALTDAELLFGGEHPPQRQQKSPAQARAAARRTLQQRSRTTRRKRRR
jgi:excinuclease ABC subunit B